jgi:glyoxylase-like metal-dependent hydrolase (beta-lactamase superfamily II)
MSQFQVTDGVHGIDVELFDEAVTSVYLFDDAEPALVDAGTAASADTIVDGMRECGVEPATLDHLVLSHVHTDHTGAAADLVEANPDLSVYIHEMTAPHLVDPTGLVESSKEAMGEHFQLMGEQDPVPEANVVEVSDDGASIDLGEHTLEMSYAPGHSPDHLAVWNPERRLLFAAECLGIYLQRADRWLPPSTLPNFDVDMLEDAIDHLRRLDPEQIVFPHFGEWPRDTDEAFETAERELHRFDERILEIHGETDSRDETKRRVAEELVDASPPYDGTVESFYASLVTDGYLRDHGVE